MDARRWRSFAPRLDGGEPFDLVIMDQAMPHLSGGQLAVEVKALAPQTRVILLTGMSLTGQEEAAGAPAVDLTIHKPVMHASLREAIHRVMLDYVPAAAKASGEKAVRAQPRVKISGFPVHKRAVGAAPIRRSGRPPKSTVRITS